MLERALALRQSSCLSPEDIGPESRSRRVHLVDLPLDGVALDEIVRDAVVQALERTGWNRSRAARLLQVPRHILLYRMQKLGIGPPDPDTRPDDGGEPPG